MANNNQIVAAGAASGAWRYAKKAAWTALRLAFGVGILAYLFKSGRVDFRALWNLVVAWPITIGGLTFLLVDVLLMAMRTSLLLRASRFYLSLGNATRLTLVGFFFSTFLPGAAGGDLAKVYYATKENQGQRAEVTAILLFDRLIGLVSLLCLPLIAAPFFRGLIESVAVLRYLLFVDGVLTLSLISGMGLVMSSARVRRGLSLESFSWLGERNILSRMVGTIGGYGRTPGAVFSAFALSLLANGSLIVVTWLAALAIHPFGVSGKLFLVAPIGHVVNSLPLTPGGLGIGETAFRSLFLAAGIRGGAETLLCWRVWNILVGLLGLVIYLFGIGRTVSDAPPPEAAGASFPDFADANTLKSSTEG